MRKGENLNENENRDLIHRLIDYHPNTILEISHIESESKVTQRLTTLGLIPKLKIKILSEAPFNGPIQIEVRGTRLVLGRGLAEKIFVHEIKGE